MYLAVHDAIPYLQTHYAAPPLIGWWLSSGIILFAFFVIAMVGASRQATSFKGILRVLRLRSLDRQDRRWVVGGLVAVFAMTGLITLFFSRILDIDLLSQESYASFLKMEALQPHEYWLFLVWLPYFFFNIFGEEFLWRGYLLPRQIHVFGDYAWTFNGCLWAIFHFGIGWRLAILLLPIEFTVPYVVQKRQNTWLGIIIHGVYNGSGFLLVALGVVT